MTPASARISSRSHPCAPARERRPLSAHTPNTHLTGTRNCQSMEGSEGIWFTDPPLGVPPGGALGQSARCQVGRQLPKLIKK